MSITCQDGVYSQHLAPSRMPGSNNAAQRDSPLNSLSASLSQIKKKQGKFDTKMVKNSTFSQVYLCFSMSKGLANLENICASVCNSEGQQNGTLQV